MKSELTQQKSLNDEITVWKLRTEYNMTELEIADRTGFSRHKVSKILLRVAARMNKSLESTLMVYRLEQTEKLNKIYMQAMEAWEESRKPRKHKSRRTWTSGTTEEVDEETDQSGDPRLLAEARMAMQTIQELWGLQLTKDTSRRTQNELPMVAQVNFNAPVTMTNMPANLGNIAEKPEPILDADVDDDEE